MWLTEDGVIHVNRSARPEDNIDLPWQKRLLSLSDTEKVRLALALDELIEEVQSEVLATFEFSDSSEADFRDEWIPDDIVLFDVPHETDLILIVQRQVRQVPRRWALELLRAPRDFVFDNGPRLWKWRRLVRCLERAESRTKV
ncbi:hypothetical protein [Leifsonia xyli]|uniref:hypothetical protein n=1 Tax=Leifsonia xyli TaxID=1575 RepID=UPI0012FE016D